ncbi:MAG: LPS-assembly protein LptD [Rhodobiaceae bacterium]|nr:LPS-assembly protein LptD [Rhodobiaceae bacterium]MCC0053026.1 LPS-assembly protein LptD [Rhodobiaceae bacterium]
MKAGRTQNACARGSRWFATGALACLLGALLVVLTGVSPLASRALAQATQDATGAAAGVVSTPFGEMRPDPNERMLLEADEIIYDYDNEVVSAVGNVQIYYSGYTIVADRVVYEQRLARLKAIGNVRITEPGGNIIIADSFDLNENLRDGFVDSLQVVAPDESRFGAASAEQRDNTIIFSDGTFTACPACKEDPRKPLTWQIKAARIIYDRKEQMVYYEDARFEFLGVPVAYVPYFFHAAPENKRKSGFLAPEIEYSSKRGLGVGVPYYWAIAPDKDLTITPVGFTNQGFMLKGHYRQRFESGTVEVRGAGINQIDPGEFGTEPGNRDWRGYAETWGRFRINKFWNWGFDGILVSDRTFIGDYRLETNARGRSQLFLSGLSTRNYFNAQAIHYTVLNQRDYQDELPVVHPVIDYNYVLGQNVAGGTVRFNANVTSMTRDQPDYMPLNTTCDETVPASITPANCFLNGTPGTFSRGSAEVDWRRTLNLAGGHLFTPFLSARGDLFYGNVTDPDGNIATFTATTGGTGGRSVARGMAAAGLEWRYPLLATHSAGYSVFEPIVQVIARPDEQNVGKVVNEDAQSFVFDDTNLFAWDKFSGYDRIEGGSRANVGFKLKTRLDNGHTIDAVFGQSFHLGGRNPFPTDSGLESDRSDFVGAIYFSPNPVFRLAAKGRFDQNDLALKRADLQAALTTARFSGTLTYSAIDAQPSLGYSEDRQEIAGTGSYKFRENWSIFGSARYDIADTRMLSHSVGLKYEDLCYAGSLVYENVSYSSDDVEADERIMFRFSFRHIGGTQIGTSLPNN